VRKNEGVVFTVTCKLGLAEKEAHIEYIY